jgi:hypothetical protein
MNEHLDRGGLSSSSAPSGPLAEVGSGASSRPTGPAQRPSSAPSPRAKRIGLATATIAALGTFAIAIAAAGGLAGAPAAPAMVTVAATQAAVQPSPTEQVVIDTVYVNAPAPSAQPPLIVPSKVKATPRPPIRVVQVVPGTGGENEGDGQAESEGGSD